MATINLTENDMTQLRTAAMRMGIFVDTAAYTHEIKPDTWFVEMMEKLADIYEKEVNRDYSGTG